MTDLVDIYEAAGAKLNADRTAAELPPVFNSFEIVLRVVPDSISFTDGEKPMMTFAIMLKEDLQVADGIIRWVQYNETITLPINQVQILKEK